jgi:hypothetical protein
MQDKYFEEEIKSIRNGLREYKDTRKSFNSKLAQIIQAKTYPTSHYETKSECVTGLTSAYNLSSDVAETECSRQFGPGQGTVTGTRQVNQAYRDQKEQQQAAAQNGGTVRHITARNASVQEVDEIPAWVITHDYLFDKTQANYKDESSQPQLKSAAIEDNRPAWLKTRSRFVFPTAAQNATGSISNETSANINAAVEQNVKSGSVESSEIPAWLTTYDYLINKRMA